MFIRNGAPKFDFVIGLDEETINTHPAWPGQPVTACWAYPVVLRGNDPSSQGIAAVQTLLSLRMRVEFLVTLLSKSKSRSDLQQDLRDLSHVTGL
jgi:hypothetical protein